MNADELISMNTPTLVKEKVICHSCGNLVSMQNYCPICDNALP